MEVPIILGSALTRQGPDRATLLHIIYKRDKLRRLAMAEKEEVV